MNRCRDNPEATVFSAIKNILAENSEGKILTPEETFARLGGDEYFSCSRSFIHLAPKSQTLDRNGERVDPPYLIAYKNRPDEHENLNLFEFAKRVIFLLILCKFLNKNQIENLKLMILSLKNY